MAEVEVNERGEGFPDKVKQENVRKYNKQRLLELAQHKQPKGEWWTCVGPDVEWGTQQMIWPITETAMQASVSRRVRELAKPKRNFQEEKEQEDGNKPIFFYSCGRSSPITDVTDGAKTTNATTRIEQLATAKNDFCNHKDDIAQFVYSCGRTSPLTVPQRIQGAERPRTTALSVPKHPPASFMGSREIQTIIPTAALKARASERVEALANPKERPLGPFREPEWTVSDSAKNAAASSRCVELARAKGLAEGYLPRRPIEWPITKAAKRAIATQRVAELSQPIVRASMDHLQFNPDAFIVKESALKGTCPRRVDELAQPIQR